MKSFGLDQQFQKVKQSTKEALGSIFPIEGKTRTLKLIDVTLEDKLEDDAYADQAKVKAKSGTWGVPVYAKLALYERGTNKLLDSTDKIKLFTLPKVTNRYSYIVNGNEYQVTNQLRLKSGAYALRKQNGELKTQVNLAAGKNFDLMFNEKNAQFTIDKVGGGQARIPLYPILTSLGISHGDIERAWGTQIAMANKLSDEKVVTRAKTSFGIRKGTLQEYFEGTKISPETTKITLGQSFDRVSGPMLLKATKKLLDVHFGRQEADDRDAMQFKDIHGVEDFIKERLEKNKTSLAFRVKRTIDNPKREKISQLINPGAFNNVVESFFTQDDRSATPEQTNPLEMLSGQYKATIMGPGGVKSDHAVTDDMRELHSSHYGFIDPIHTPESKRIGANLHLPLGFKKDGNEIKMLVLDHSGKPVELNPAQAYHKKIAFPGQSGPKYKVNYRGKTVEVSKSEVDYFTPKAEALFSWSTNLIPFLPADQGNRSMMAAKQLEQAISLKHREAPLVQVEAVKGKSMESVVGEDISVKAPEDGVVKDITEEHITLKTAKGDIKVGLYNHFALNRKSFLHHYPSVKKGEAVKKGQVIADSNFTKGGVLALGTNMRVAYIPYKGYNFEDGIVITESAADKLTSEHIHKKDIAIDDTTILKLSVFRTQYPNAATADNLAKLDEQGVIKKGAKVRQGDIVIAALQKRQLPKSVTIIEKKLSDRPKDASVAWTYEDEGIVTDVIKTTSSITVNIKTDERAKIGDKLSGRHGNKGIITKIIKDEEAPKDKTGKPVDILLNPHGVISRINMGQMYESAAAKAAAKEGKPYMVKNFSGENYLETTKGFIDKAKTPDKEELFDANGKSLGKVHVGNPYILKLFKLSQGNFSTRQGGPGHSYDANMQPLKAGGEEAAKNLDVLTMYSMLSHGARANLRDMAALKSNQNDEFWKALKSGQTLPPPKTTFVFDKFTNYLKAAGINITKDGTKMTLGPMTDDEVEKMSSGEVKKPMFFRGKDMEPIKGGFLDPIKFGGFKGTKWGHMDLKEPVVNPVFEKAVRKITDLGSKYDGLVEGRLFYNNGEFNSDGKGLTGGKALEKILKDIDVDEQIAILQKKAKTARASTLDDINKKLRYFLALKQHKLTPDKAYIRNKVAVIPPVYRPIYPLPDGSTTTSDVNLIYQNLGILNTMQKLPVMDLLPEDEKALIRKDINTHVKGLSGLTDISIKGKERAGFISEIAGTQPKEGFFISKMISRKQDYVGRATIIPEPSLGVDEVGMPEQMAWKIFDPFITRELVTKFGKTPIQAIDEIKKKTPLAKKALEVVMTDRKVLLNRAPSLHKFSIMAFKPKLTSGTALKIPPLVVKGFNADFNGDSASRLTMLVVEYTDIITQSTSVLCDTMENIFKMVTGKSVEQMIVEAKGYTAIYEILPDTLRTIGVVDGKIKKTSIKNLTVHTSHGPCFKIKTHTGTTGVFSEHHNFSYIDENLNLRCVKTEVMPTNVLVPKSDLRSSWPESDILTTEIDGKTVVVDEDFGYLLGFYAGDGHLSDRRHSGRGIDVGFTDTEGQALEMIDGILRRKGFVPGSRQGTQEHPKCKILVYNTKLGEWLIEHAGVGFEKKVVPTLILNSPESVRLSYIAGLLEAESNICEDGFGNNVIRVEMNNDIFIRQFRILMESCGISSYYKETFSNETEHKAWMLIIAKTSWDKLQTMPAGPKSSQIKEAFEKRASKLKVSREVFDIVPVSKPLLKEIATIGKKCRHLTKAQKESQECWRANNPGRKINFADHFKNDGKNYTSRAIAMDLIHTYGAFSEVGSLFYKWSHIVKDFSLRWELVEEINEVRREDVLFDFTVPEGETFCIDNGLITHNTMMVHAPITDEANKEADKMLPSRNLYQPGTGKLMIMPAQEAQIGLFYLSKTPAGRAIINKIVGQKHAVDGILNKKTTEALLSKISKESTAQEFGRIIAELKSAGEKYSYESGFTLGLDDLVSIKKERDLIVRAAEKDVKTSKDLLGLSNKANKLIDSILEKKLKGKDNPLYDMIESGAKGSSSQLRGILATPLFVSDSKGRVVPSPIKNSYSEGLDVADYWTSLYGARRGMMDRAIQTSLPGAFSKDIMANTLDNVVSAADCGTKKGVKISVEDKDCLNRLLAGDQGAFTHNSTIDTNLIKKAKDSGLKFLNVRSPLTCMQPKGTCAKCHGLDETGQLPEVGDNIGAKAGQTIAEPLVQLVMNTFHTGGAAGTGADAGGYKRIDQLLKLPKYVPNAATLSPVTGKVKKIDKGLAGGFDVVIGDHKVHVSQGRAMKVSVGEEVEMGDPISDGVVKPQDLVKLKGMQPAQEYIVDELKKAYSGQGVNIDRKVFETIVRSFGNTTQVVNNPKGSNFVPGDVAPYTLVRHYNENLNETVSLAEAEGDELAQTYGNLKAGTIVGARELAILKASGYNEVEIKKEPIKHTPMLKSVTTLPILKRNWMSALGYRNLAKALTEGAGQAWETDLEDYHPIPAFAYGANFGKGKDGKY
jgi:DNA-directed RNA polymerase beta subunit/DNA-directed RNA polymerase beta' subunit